MNRLKLKYEFKKCLSPRLRDIRNSAERMEVLLKITRMLVKQGKIPPIDKRSEILWHSDKLMQDVSFLVKTYIEKEEISKWEKSISDYKKMVEDYKKEMLKIGFVGEPAVISYKIQNYLEAYSIFLYSYVFPNLESLSTSLSVNPKLAFSGLENEFTRCVISRLKGEKITELEEGKRMVDELDKLKLEEYLSPDLEAIFNLSFSISNNPFRHSLYALLRKAEHLLNTGLYPSSIESDIILSSMNEIVNTLYGFKRNIEKKNDLELFEKRLKHYKNVLREFKKFLGETKKEKKWYKDTREIVEEYKKYFNYFSTFFYCFLCPVFYDLGESIVLKPEKIWEWVEKEFALLVFKKFIVPPKEEKEEEE